MKKLTLLNIGTILIIFLAAQAAFAITIKLTDRKLSVNDDTDDSLAVQMALNELLTSGGGTIEFPAGVVDIRKSIRIVPEEYKPVNIILKGDGGSVVRVSVGQGETAFYFGNNNQLHIDNMIFTGKNVPAEDPAFFDAQYVIFAGWVSLVKITNSSFFGIAVPNGGAIINVASNLTIENCQFDGNNAGYPDGAVVNLDCCALEGRNANIRNTTFNDYTHFNGKYLSKTYVFTGNWVRAKQVHWAGNTANQRLSIEDSFFDEGAAVSISAENIGSVNVRGTRFNINGSDAGTGLKVSNVTRVRIEDSFFGFSNNVRPLAILSDSSVEMIGITRGNQVQCPQADAETTISWRLSDCN